MTRLLSKTIRSFLITARIELAGFSFVAVIGAMTVCGKTIPLSDTLMLFVFNVLLVIFGFIHNDYEDLDIDKRLPELSNRPLVNGSVSRRQARYWSISLFILALLLAHLYFRDTRTSVLFFSALFLAAVYNKLSKRILGADIFYGLSSGALFLFGAAAVSGGHESFSIFTLLMTGVMVLEHLFFNIASGQLKDVRFDRAAGVKTLAVALSRVENGVTHIHPAFKALCLAIKLTTYSIIFSLFFFSIIPVYRWQIILLALFTCGSFFLSVTLLYTPIEQREKILDCSRKQEVFSKSLTPMVLLPQIGIFWLLIFTVGPVIWFSFFNYLLNREFLGNPKTF